MTIYYKEMTEFKTLYNVHESNIVDIKINIP